MYDPHKGTGTLLPAAIQLHINKNRRLSWVRPELGDDRTDVSDSQSSELNFELPHLQY